MINTFLVKFQYQGDDRVEDVYVAYMNTDDEDDVRDSVEELDCYEDLVYDCICNWKEEDDDDDEEYVTVEVELVDSSDIDKSYQKWLDTLETLIDERDDTD